jgi:hypothetical protein
VRNQRDIVDMLLNHGADLDPNGPVSCGLNYHSYDCVVRAPFMLTSTMVQFI